MERKTKAILATLITAIIIFTTLASLAPQNPTPTLALPQQATTTNKQGNIPPQDAPPWWNATFKYRVPINITNNADVNATIPVDVYLNFTQLGYGCHKDSVRVQYWDGASWLPEPGITYQIWNETLNGNYIQSATITFHANVTKYSTTTYYIYFSDAPVSKPSFTQQVNAILVGSAIIVNGKYYKAYINTTAYGGKMFECYNTFYEGNWSKTPFHNDPNFTRRIQLQGPATFTEYATNGNTTIVYVSLSYDSGPLFVMLTSRVRFHNVTNVTDVLNTYANITYRFFEWGWICNTTTVFQENFNKTGKEKDYVSEYRSCGYSFKFGVMSKLVDENGERDITIGTSDIFSDWFCTLSETSGTAAGIVSLNFNGSILPSWKFVLDSRSDSLNWRRTTGEAYPKIGDWISDCYVFYIWNGSQGYSPFASFARALKNSFMATGAVEEKFFSLILHIKDWDGQALAGASVEIRRNGTDEQLLGEVTDEDGKVVFNLYDGTYNVTVVWNEVHEGMSQSYSSSVVFEFYNVDVVEERYVQLPIVSLTCHVVYSDGENAPYTNVSIYNATDGQLFLSGFTNGSGWIKFYLPLGEYNVSIFEGSTLVNSTAVVLSTTSELTMVYPIQEPPTPTALIVTSIVNGTRIDSVDVSVTWGVYQFTIEARWVNTSSNSGIDLEGDRYAQYRINYGEWLNLTPQGGGYYFADLTGLLFGGKVYVVEFRAGGSGLRTALNYTTIRVSPVQLNRSMVSVRSVSGIIWNETNITMWVSVWDSVNGFPVTSATVTWRIEGYGSGTFSHNYGGNYTGTIRGDLLPPGNYWVEITVECVNYTTYSHYKPLSILPRPLSLDYEPTYEVVFGDMLEFYVYCKDNLTGSPLSSAAIFFSIEKTTFFGVLTDADGDGNYTGTFDTSLLPSGKSYSIRINVFLENYTSVEKTIYLSVKPVPMSIQNVQVSETRWRETLNLTLTVWDAHNNVPVEDANVSCVIRKDGVVVFEAQLENSGGGVYTLSIDTTSMLPGKYTVVFSASKKDYSAQPMQVEFSILPVAASVTPANNLVLVGTAPYLVLLGGYGEVENSVPFVVLVFEYKDAYGNPVPGATMTANGVPLTYIGDGRYILVVPTGAPSTIPIVVSASAENYESSQTFQVLNVKERSVVIPGINVRVPLTMFLVVSLAVIAPPASLAGYVYVKRMSIPPIIRRIDSLIEAIEKGARVEVKKPLTRDDVILSLLWEEMAIVGVEPRIAAMPVEVVDKLVPLLVESGLSSEEAITVLKELKASAPADRERLLASIGVPPDISATILGELEKQEEKEDAEKAKKVEEEAEEKNGKMEKAEGRD